MQRLPSPGLVPSSSEGGNLVQESLARLTMTAPGSDPVSPLPGPAFQSDPEPRPAVAVQDGPLGITDHIPVGDTTRRITVGMPRGSTRWAPTPAGSDDLGRDGRERGPVPQPAWPAVAPDNPHVSLGSQL